MADNEWKLQVMSFLKKAGDDIKKVGEDVKSETARLMEELKNPEKQEAARAKLADLGVWAKKTAENAAGLAEVAMKKVEDKLSTASDFVSESVAKGGLRHDTPLDTPAAQAPSEAPSKPRKATKTVGRKSPGGAKKSASAKSPSKKTVGRKKG